MATTSNIYAEKIFSEHPTQLWALDEKADFVSYFTETDRDMSTWSKSGTTTNVSVTKNTPQFEIPTQETTFKITKNPTGSETSTLTLTSTAKDISGSTVSFYFFTDTLSLQSISVQVGSETAQSTTISSINSWTLISNTFSDTISAGVRVKISFNYVFGSSGTNNTYINALSWGNDSENFNGVSTGIVPTPIPSNIAYGNTYAWTGTANASTSTKSLNGWSTPNLITNPDFETNANDWLASAITVSRDTSQYFIGSASLKLIINGADPYAVNIPGGVSNSRISVIPGRTYTFSYYIKKGTSTTKWSAQLKGYNTNSFAFGYIASQDGTPTTINSSTWTRLSVTWTIPDGITYVEARAATTADVSSSTAYIDAVLLEESPTLNSYINPNIRKNLITNPSFENGVTGWSYNLCTFVASTAQAFTSSTSGLMTAGAAGGGVGPYYQNISVTAGKTYTASIYVKDISTNATYDASIWWYNGSTALDWHHGTATAVNSSGWTRISFTEIAPATATNAWVIFQSNSGQAVGTQAYFDGAMFEQSSTLNDYFDGSFSYSLYQTPAYSYGKQNLLSNNAYYLMDTSTLYAKNTSIPMAYGGNSTTTIIPNYNTVSSETFPSLVVPGQGFMNESGKDKSLTFECWFRIGSAPSSSRRIFGPIGSTDGLYVDGPFFRLKIGKVFESKYIGEWSRPMLIQIYIGFNIAKMFLNGEEVMSFNIDTGSIAFPTFPAETVYGKDNTFLGFYAYSDTGNIELDSISIYPYEINSTIAMKRWVYGQAVEFNQHLNSSYSGKTAMVDYAFAEYSNNYSFPKNQNWQSGITENIVTDNSVLSSPKYDLPKYYLTYSTLLYDFVNQPVEINSSLTFSSDSFANYFNVATNSKLIFSSLNQINSETKGIYGIFKRTEISSSSQTLLYLVNEITQEYLRVSINDSTVSYAIKTNDLGAETSIATVTSIPETFVVGFDIDSLVNNSPFNISTFFTNKERLKVYVGGSDLENNFSGNIYKIAFASKYDVSFLSTYFNSNGTVNTQNLSSINNYTSSYELVTIKYFENFLLDIKSNSYWQESVPLKKLSKYVKDGTNNNVYDLDFLQINIDYPEPVSQITGNLDLSSSLIKTYITFQKLADGANKYLNSFNTTYLANNEGVIVADSNWKLTKYEVVNGSIVYVPKTFDTGESLDDYAITLHIEIVNPGILRNPIKIRSLEILSKSLNYSLENPVGTKFGNNLIPYNDSTGTRSYKDKNPIRIYKGSTPQLYLTKHSGVKLSGNSSFGSNRGYLLDMSLPEVTDTINLLNKNLGFVQLALRWNYETFPITETEIFRIKSADGDLIFYMIAKSTSTNKAKIYAKLLGLEYSVSYYWNGNFVKNPVIKSNEWGMLGAVFLSPITLDNQSSINITSNLLVNNISYYTLTDNQLAQNQYTENAWSSLPSTWTLTSTKTWKDIYINITPVLPAVNPIQTYSSYIGSNKITALGESDANSFVLNKTQYSSYFGLYNKHINADIA